MRIYCKSLQWFIMNNDKRSFIFETELVTKSFTKYEIFYSLSRGHLQSITLLGKVNEIIYFTSNNFTFSPSTPKLKLRTFIYLRASLFRVISAT